MTLILRQPLTGVDIRVWNEWAACRATTKDKYSHCFVVHMHLLSEKVHYLCIAHLSVH